MPLTSLDEDWQTVSPHWWRISSDAVLWSYPPTDSLQNAPATRVTQPHRVAKPPHYHLALFFNRAVCADDPQYEEDIREADDGTLNSDLVGFKAADAALESYEIDVGFHWPPSAVEVKSQPDLSMPVNEDRVALAKDRWDEFVQDLTGGLSIANTDRYHDSDDESTRGLHRSTSTLSSIDLTDSERSIPSVSMPATPRAPRSYANIVVKTVSPSRSASSRDSGRSPRRLNAAASTFVPSPAKAKVVPDSASSLAAPAVVSYPSLNKTRSPSPSFNTNFVFPTLDVPPLPAVKIAKDEQGFYSEVEVTPTMPPPTHARSSSTLLPAFLQDAFTRRRPAASKTRAIVDRLKSSGSVAAPESTKSHVVSSPQLELSALSKPRLSVSEYGSDGETPSLDGNDGWIGGDELAAKAAAAVSSKSRRTRDLFLALTRRRSNSSPPKPTLIVEPPADDVVGIAVQLPSPSPSPSSSSTDGWIEGPALLGLHASKSKHTAEYPPERKLAPPEKPPTHRQPSLRALKKSKRTGSVPIATMQPPPGAAFYPPYYYPHAHPHPPVPVPYAAAYMHQMQVLQMQQQHQMHMRRVSAPSVPIPVRTPRGSISS
ncbi:glycoside hydrolase family 31 protein, partial [Favolaschia claudopus]